LVGGRGEPGASFDLERGEMSYDSNDSESCYEAIERLAEGLIEKSGDDMSKDAAVARILKSAEGKRLYAAYSDAYFRERAASGR
jgi:hypothetical protein